MKIRRFGGADIILNLNISKKGLDVLRRVL